MSIGFDRDGFVVTITLDGLGDGNALTAVQLLELDERLIEFDDDPGLRSAILRGAGEHHFSVGSAPFAEARDDLEPHLQRHWYPRAGEGAPRLDVVWSTIFARRTVKPIVAAVQGDCLGAALALLGLHTDLRVAGESARFGFEDAALGAGLTVVSRLEAQIQPATLNWMIETGESIGARRAHACFLVNEVVADERVFDRAADMAGMVAALPPIAVRAEKLALVHLERTSYESAVFLSMGLLTLEMLSEDAQEGLRAFQEKRKPAYKGR